MLSHPFKIYIVLVFCVAFFSCVPDTKQRQEALFKQYCASCHLAPSLDALPKHLWQEKVLPEMAARMGIRDSTNDPYKNLSLSEQGAILKTGMYPSNPIIKKEDWNLLQDYILDNAPDAITKVPKRNLNIITQFDTEVISIDSISGSNISYINYNADSNKIYCGSLRGNLVSYDFSSKNVSHVLRAGSTITHFSQFADTTFLTTIGFLLPSELPAGDLGIKEGANIKSLPQKLHRPVYTTVKDLNKNGNKELIISEFGDLKGQLSLWSKNKSGHYIESVLRSQPGTTRTIVQDMNNDGKDDIIVLASQGDENIEIFFQKDNLEFYGERVLRFPPQYGTSWFELVDFNKDAFLT